MPMFAKSFVRTATAVAALGLMASAAHAALLFDQNVTPGVIFGSGNANGAFTVNADAATTGIELGLRGKLRHNAAGAPENTFNSNGDGTYGFTAGVAPTQAFPTAVWSFEWSINTNTTGQTGFALDDLTYALGLDSDPSQGTSYLTFDLINGAPYFDHALGDNTTTQGPGNPNVAPDAAAYAAAIASLNVAQNSWKPHWFIPGFDPTVDGTYNFYLAAFSGGQQLARTDIQIIVGQGGAAVPVPGTLALAGLALLGLAGMSRRRG